MFLSKIIVWLLVPIPEFLILSNQFFSDGVTTIKKSLFNIIQEWIEPKYTDEDLKLAVEKYQHCPPNSKESLYYRCV